MSKTKPPLNIVLETMEVFGALTTDRDLRIEGVVRGDAVTSGRLVLAAGGKVGGRLIARSAEIHGVHLGDVIADDHVVLRAASRVRGRVECRRVTFEAGAEHEGLLVLRRSANGKPDVSA